MQHGNEKYSLRGTFNYSVGQTSSWGFAVIPRTFISRGFIREAPSCIESKKLVKHNKWKFLLHNPLGWRKKNEKDIVHTFITRGRF